MKFKHILLGVLLAVGGMTLTNAVEVPQPKAEIYLPGLDLSIDQIVLDPPSGSTLKATEPISVSFRYRYTKPRVGLRAWAKVLDETYDSTHQGSMDYMAPGSGTIERFVFLNVPGQIKTITLMGKDPSSKEAFRLNLPVNYTFVRNAEVEAQRSEGAGSALSLIGTSPPFPAVVKVGTAIEFKLAHDINTQEGLLVMVEPVTQCNMGYDGTTYPVFGKGVESKRIWIGEPCELKQVKIGLVNQAHSRVVEKVVDVDFKIIK